MTNLYKLSTYPEWTMWITCTCKGTPKLLYWTCPGRQKGEHIMYKWFRECKTAEQGKQKYRELVKQYHPDNGGSGEELKEISSEFSTWWDHFKNIHTNSQGETYTSEKETTETAEEFMDIIRNLSNLSGIEVEICGSWLWITGNTYPVRTQLSEFGCRWSRGKKKWYWTQDEFTKAKYKKPSMAQIRQRYGSEKVHLQPNLCLE